MFPNAHYYLSEIERDYWMDEAVVVTSRLPEPMKEMSIGAARFQIGGMKDKLELIRAGQEILLGITAIPAPGHTIGQLAFRIDTQGQSLLYTSDTMHTTAVSLEHPEWVNGMDHDGQLGVQTRKHFLDGLSADRVMSMTPHFPFPAVGHVVRRGGSYAFEPIYWQW